jgi:carotenoid 1,2-hydratase
MRLVLDPAEEAAHGEWLRRTPGAYEWWYFDALSDDGEWVLSCIWFLGNPFSPYYRQSALGKPSSPFEQNALFFALYHQGRLHAYHFTRFPESEISAEETPPLRLRFGPNRLAASDGEWRLELADENANGRSLNASLVFTSPSLAFTSSPLAFTSSPLAFTSSPLAFTSSPLVAAATQDSAAIPETALDSEHSWLPAAPFCRVTGRIELRETQNPGSEEIHFTGTGYHDHNWGRLPFDAAIRDWYWARAALSEERSVILYHVQPHHGPAVSHLLLFEQGRLTRCDAQAKVCLSRPVLNGFGTRYFSRLAASGAGLDVVFRFGTRLDSAPFYLRVLCRAEVGLEGQTEIGQGIGEYLRPRLMSWPLVASAMKARIVER